MCFRNTLSDSLYFGVPRRIGQSASPKYLLRGQPVLAMKLNKMATMCSTSSTDLQNCAQQAFLARLKKLYPAVDEEDTPLPKAWSQKDKYNFIGLSQNNLRVHYKGQLNFVVVVVVIPSLLMFPSSIWFLLVDQLIIMNVSVLGVSFIRFTHFIEIFNLSFSLPTHSSSEAFQIFDLS